MNLYWPQPGSDPTKPELVSNRAVLVERFNKIVGIRNADDSLFQQAFIDGKIPYDEAVSFIRLASFKLATTTEIELD